MMCQVRLHEIKDYTLGLDIHSEMRVGDSRQNRKSHNTH